MCVWGELAAGMLLAITTIMHYILTVYPREFGFNSYSNASVNGLDPLGQCDSSYQVFIIVTIAQDQLPAFFSMDISPEINQVLGVYGQGVCLDLTAPSLFCRRL